MLDELLDSVAKRTMPIEPKRKVKGRVLAFCSRKTTTREVMWTGR